MLTKVEHAVILFKKTNKKLSSFNCPELTALIKSMTEKEFQEYARITEEWQVNH